MSSLIYVLKQVPDPRKAHGKSHPLWMPLLLVIMGTIAGYQGYRPLDTFVHKHYKPLRQQLGIEFKRPLYSTFRTQVLFPWQSKRNSQYHDEAELDDLSDCFEQWILSQSAILFPNNSVAGLDSKRIRQK